MNSWFIMIGSRNKMIKIATIVGIMVCSTGCSDFLSVHNPSSLTDKDINNKSEIPILLNSAEGTVLKAYPLTILLTGLIADGIMSTGTQSEFKKLDQGVFNSQSRGRTFTINETYNALGVAHWTSQFVENKIRKLSEKSEDIRLAKAEFYESLSLVLLADSWDKITLDGKAPISPKQTYELAVTKLKDAFSIANTLNDEFRVPVLGLLARTTYSLYVLTDDNSYLNEAVSYAKQSLDIDDNFILKGTYSQTSQQNEVYEMMNTGQLMVGTGYGFIKRKDIYSGKPDPRVPYGTYAQKSPAGDPIYRQQKYPSYNANIPIVKWQEMNLILAEDELEKSNVSEAMKYINKNRNIVDLPDMKTNDIKEAYKYLIYERGSELWLEGRRWFDMRHFGISFDRWSKASVAKGTDRKLPIPSIERNSNPNLNN
jgi:hypothetical protein